MPIDERGVQVRQPDERASALLPEVSRYMDVSEVAANRITGRIREPIAASLTRLKELFRSLDLTAYFSDRGGGHEIIYGPPRRLRPPRRWINLVLFLATIGSTLLVGTMQAGHNPFNLLNLVHGIPFSLSIILILGSHELGHYFTARRLGVDATLPYFLPVPHPMTGTMGAFIKIRSPVPSKGALVKVGVSGPLVGFLVAIPVTVIGLSLSRTVTVHESAGGIQLGSSLIFWLLSFLRFGSLPAGVDVMLHPVAFAGWLGFFITALNLLPVGQLDGGHVAYAVLGKYRKAFNWVVLGCLLLMGFFWLGWPFWAVMIAVFGLRHPPPLDDITTLGRTEKLLALAGLVLFVLTFMPAPFGQVRF